MKAWEKFKQFKLHTLLLLLAAVGVLIYEAWLLSLLLRVPGDRAGIFFGRQVIVKQVPAGSPLQAEDVILRIGDLEVNAYLLAPRYRGTTLEQEAGAIYTIRRAGQEMEVFVPWRPYTFSEVFWRGAGLWVVGVGMALTAIVLFTAKHNNLQAVILSIGFVTMGLNQINNMFPTASANIALTYARLFMPLDAMAVWLGVSMGLHAMLIFPQVKAPVQRFPWLPWCIHAVTPVCSLMGAVLSGAPTLLEKRALMFDIANPLMMVETVLMLTALGHTYMTNRQPGVRNQIRWIFWGFSIPFTVWVLFYALPSLILGSPWLPLSVTNTTLVILPLSFAISIFRFGLMDVDRVINRTLVYAGAGVTLFIIYALIVSWMRAVLPQVDGRSNDLLAGLIGMLVLFAVFNPLRMYMQRLVDRAFFKEQLDFYQILRELGQELSATIILDEVQQILNQQAAQRLGLSFASALLVGENRADCGDEVTNVQCRQECAPLQVFLASPLTGLFDAERAPLAVYQWEKLPVAVREHVRALSVVGVEICMPLFQQSKLLGLYFFGSKESGNLLSREEVNALELLSQQAATMIQNAQFYAELQDYNRLLEARVAARTAELSAERNRLDTILQNIADGLVATDRKGNVVLVNPAFSRVARISPERALGLPLEAVLPSEILLSLVEDALMNPGQVYTATLTGDIPGTGGRASQVYKASACALSQRSLSDERVETEEQLEVLGVVTILRDITHEYEVDRMKTDYISTVSHELRTPLTSVLGFAKLIRKSFDRYVLPNIVIDDDARSHRAVERLNDNLDIIVSEGERLTRLINDVLDIAKMEAGKIDWHMDTMHILDAITTSVNGVASLSLEREVPVVVAAGENLPAIVADQERLVQVIINLLSNALKFTPQGQVTVAAEHVRILVDHTVLPAEVVGKIPAERPPDPGLWLLVRVMDTGVGIPRERLPEVFEKFKQVSTDTLPNRPHGTGLGLPICREIVEYHGGQIWVESEVGVGSVFSFILPAIDDGRMPAPVEGLPAPEAWVTPEAVSGQRVLVVDDEPSIRALLRQVLGDAGYRVIEAADGMTALDRVRHEQPALLILDVMIPGISGFDVVSVLKGDPATASIPIIILSGVEDRERGFRLGADGYLHKPLDAELLLATIQDVLARSVSFAG
ncbi:MAG: response regulator [Anaerolineae bacterium]|nr:response regulator [Anaerolineae bacterium]